MSLADELAKLEELRRGGALSEAEFAAAKKKLLSAPAGAEPALGEHLAAQLEEVKFQNELAQLDREWELEREKYMVSGKYGRRYTPTAGGGLALSAGGGAFGVFWTAMAFGITSGAPDEGPFAIAKVFFPLFGVVFTVGAIAYGIHIIGKARQYEQAHEAHQRRRRELLARRGE